MLIQKRAAHKYHSAGLWCNICCSHPRPGEDTQSAAHRRLLEEVGVTVDQLTELFSFTYFEKFDNNLAEYEFDHVFIGEYSGSVALNKEEVEEVQWVDFMELLEDMKNNPLKYSAWFRIAAPKVIAHLI